MSSLLAIYGQLPILVREKIDEQVDNVLVHTKATVRLLITDMNYTSDTYQGLDGDRDAQDEVETAVRFFPGILSKKCMIYNEYDDDVERIYPILKIAKPFSIDGCSRCNIKALPFLILLARLGTEIGHFKEEEIGGLVPTHYQGYNVMEHLAHGIHRTINDTTEHQQLVHNLFRVVLQQLKEIGLMEKDDILKYDLVRHACCYDDGSNYTESRLRFFIDWDPASLSRPIECEGVWSGTLPLHRVIIYNCNIQLFQSVFKAGIMHFPKKKGMCLLFTNKDIFDRTPFKAACEQFGRDKVMKVVENTIADCYSDNNNNNNIIPYNPVDAFLTAVLDKNIHLDCAYFFLRRHPDILKKLVPSSAENDEGITGTNDNINTGLLKNTTAIATVAVTVPVPIPATTNPKKRKRNEDEDEDDINDGYKNNKK